MPCFGRALHCIAVIFRIFDVGVIAYAILPLSFALCEHVFRLHISCGGFILTLDGLETSNCPTSHNACRFLSALFVQALNVSSSRQTGRFERGRKRLGC
jgi:hypothetical protein